MKNKSLIGLIGTMVLTGVMSLACLTGCSSTIVKPENPTLETPTIQAPTNDGILAVDGEGNAIHAGDEVPFSSALVMTSFAGESELSYEGFTLTATVYPETASDKTVDYSVSWKDGTNAWASGKTASDYVTVTQETDGSTTATVSCLQAFGEPIIITVTSRQNPEAKAECQVDFAQQVESMQVTYYVGNEELDSYVLSSTALNLFELGIYSQGATPNYSRSWGAILTPNYSNNPYTVENDLMSYAFYFEVNSDNYAILETVEGNKTYHFTLIDFLEKVWYRGSFAFSVESYYIQGYGLAHITEQADCSYADFLMSCANDGEDFICDIYFAFEYGYFEIENIKFAASHDTYGLKAEDVELDNSGAVIS